MSTDYFLACRQCRQITPIASDSSFSGWKWFCTPEKGPVNFIGRHVAHLAQLAVVREQSLEADEFDDVAPEDSDAVGAPLERQVRPAYEAQSPAKAAILEAFSKAKVRCHMATTHMACTTAVDPKRQREANALLTTALDDLKKTVLAHLKA